MEAQEVGNIPRITMMLHLRKQVLQTITLYGQIMITVPVSQVQQLSEQKLAVMIIGQI